VVQVTAETLAGDRSKSVCPIGICPIGIRHRHPGPSYRVGGGCVLTLCPPMTISRAQLDRALDIVEAGSQALG
jgi:hypothetical protein